SPGVVWIEKQSKAQSRRQELMQQFKPSSGKRHIDESDTGYVASRSVEARDISGFNRIATSEEDDRNRRSRRFGGRYRHLAAGRVDHGHLPAHQFRGQSRHAIVAIVRKTVFNCEIAT